jgi:hypothetical protein
VMLQVESNLNGKRLSGNIPSHTEHVELDFDDLFHERRPSGHSHEKPHEDSAYYHGINHTSDDDEPDEDGALNPQRSKATLEDFELLKVVGKGGYGKVLFSSLVKFVDCACSRCSSYICVNYVQAHF